MRYVPIVTITVILTLCLSQEDNAPEQIHLSLGVNPNEMVITWATPFPTLETSVTYGYYAKFPNEVKKAYGSQKLFVDNGTLHHTLFFHRVTLPNLDYGTKYSYIVKNDNSTYYFTTAKQNYNWSPKFTVYGDFGVENPQSLPSLIQETKKGVTDVVVHLGDLAYDDWRDNSTWADKWFNMMQPIMAYMPYMVCPGNHEGLYDFLNFRSRFTMPQWEKTENLYFSWNYGITHWIAYSTEVYFVYEAMEGHGGVHRNFGPYPEIAKAQLKFIEEDLIEANKVRNEQPWIIVYGHRPMYCSDDDDDDCLKMRNQWRIDLENLFYKYGVDFVLEGHQHSYERLWPVYNGNVMNGSIEHPYTNPKAPIHIISGSAGCVEDLNTFGPPLGPWSAVRISEYGYGHLTFYNDTHAYWEQLFVNGSIADSFTIIKNEHQYF